MLKYDTELDFSINSSLTLIARRVKPGSRVLEFGPATGYMTRYFKENLGCTVVAVELDPESAKRASLFCAKMLVGNIDTYPWFEELSDERFDHIIFSDVLEHLYDPWSALKKAAQLLSKDGTMLTSIPNVAHSSIIMDLMKGRFDYQNMGLMDQTHIRFFTGKSVDDLLRQADLVPIEWLYTSCTPSQSEFKNSYHEFPPEIQDRLRNRPDAEIYQYVTVSKRSQVVPKDFTLPRISVLERSGFDTPVLRAWISTSESKLAAPASEMRLTGGDQWTTYTVEMDIPFDVHIIGLHPSNQPAVLELRNLELLDSDGHVTSVDFVDMTLASAILSSSNVEGAIKLLTFGKAQFQISLRLVKPCRVKAFRFDCKVRNDLQATFEQFDQSMIDFGVLTKKIIFRNIQENFEALDRYKIVCEQQTLELDQVKSRLAKIESHPVVKLLLYIHSWIQKVKSY